MAIFAVNTGCRNKEICSLRWDWEFKLDDYHTSAFIIPGEFVKNKQDRLVILNKLAFNVVESQRGKNDTYVFIYRDKPITHMLNMAWRRARKEAGLDVRVHDLRHTFGSRLRSANVSFEDRQDLLGHKSKRITTHYSEVEIGNLLIEVNKICVERKTNPIFAALRKAKQSVARSRKSPARKKDHLVYAFL